jgi:hypothetical protein
VKNLKTPKNPNAASKQRISEWFLANSARREPVEKLIELIRSYFVDDSDHGYLNKKKENVYQFGDSYASFGRARIIFSKKHSNVRFWVKGSQHKLAIPEAGIRKRLRSASGSNLYVVEFKISTHKETGAIRKFLSSNEIPGWVRKPSCSRTFIPNSPSETENESFEPQQDKENTRENEDEPAIEGRETERRTLSKSRNKAIITRRKEKDEYTCAVCKFRLQIQEKFVIECHHLTLHSAVEEGPVSLSDLVCLCPTCHGIAHCRIPPFTVKEIVQIRAESFV